MMRGIGVYGKDWKPNFDARNKKVEEVLVQIQIQLQDYESRGKWTKMGQISPGLKLDRVKLGLG